MLRGRIADQRLAAAHDLAEQAVEVAQLHALGRMLGIGAVPGNVADAVGVQVGRALFVLEHFANEAELAGGQLENAR
ncbi:hypothetical protein FQZ97_920770 [compost metagenome]